jgi:nitroreductase
LNAPFDITVTDRLLSTTRTVRRRLDLERPVEREVIWECLRLAVQAPTGGNAQRWRWLVVTDPTKRAQLAQLYSDGGYDHLESAARLATDLQTRRVYDSALHLARVLDRVPVHVIPFIEGRIDKAPNEVAAGKYASIMPAIWNFMLALRSRGLGSAWTTLHLTKERAVAELLGVPFEEVMQVALIPVAYTTGGDFKPASRPPVERITYWNEWGATR